MDEDLLQNYREVVVSYVKHLNCGASFREIAEEVGQKMALEAMNQRKTQEYLRQHIDQIRQNHLPGNLRKRASHLVRKLGGSAGCGPVTCDMSLIEDKHVRSDYDIIDSKIDVYELAKKDARVARLASAYASGYETKKEIAAYLGISERTLYEWFSDVRRRCDKNHLANQPRRANYPEKQG